MLLPGCSTSLIVPSGRSVILLSASGRSSLDSQKSIECLATSPYGVGGAHPSPRGAAPLICQSSDLPSIWMLPIGYCQCSPGP